MRKYWADLRISPTPSELTENVEYSRYLAHWDTSGYPDWPETLVEQGVAKVEHKNVLNSVFWLPLRYLTAHLNNEPNPMGACPTGKWGS